MLGCEPAELRHETLPKRKPMKRGRRRPPVGLPGAPVAAVSEVTVEAASGAFNGEVLSRGRALGLAREHDPATRPAPIPRTCAS